MSEKHLIGCYVSLELFNRFNELSKRTISSKSKLLEDAIIRYIEYRGVKDSRDIEAVIDTGKTE